MENLNKGTGRRVMDSKREVEIKGGQTKKTNDKSRELNWGQYCEEIGSSRQVVNRWLNEWFGEEELPKLLNPPPLPKGKFDIIYAEVKMGEMLKNLPSRYKVSSRTGTDSLPDGITKKESTEVPAWEGRLCGSTAGTTKILPNGITKKESHYAQTLADN